MILYLVGALAIMLFIKIFGGQLKFVFKGIFFIIGGLVNIFNNTVGVFFKGAVFDYKKYKKDKDLFGRISKSLENNRIL